MHRPNIPLLRHRLDRLPRNRYRMPLQRRLPLPLPLLLPTLHHPVLCTSTDRPIHRRRHPHPPSHQSNLIQRKRDVLRLEPRRFAQLLQGAPDEHGRRRAPVFVRHSHVCPEALHHLFCIHEYMSASA